MFLPLPGVSDDADASGQDHLSAMSASSAWSGTDQRSAGRRAIDAATRRPEPVCIAFLNDQMGLLAKHAGTDLDPGMPKRIRALAQQLVQAVRSERTRASGVDALMQEFSLASEEGIALMCMAEALLRIPDTATADRLIADKLGHGDWRRHLGESPSLFVNAATWGLLITGKLVATRTENGLGAALGRLLTKGGEPLVRRGVELAMRMLGNQFVAGQTIGAALASSLDGIVKGYRYSYDMLGEAALTAGDAQRYFDSYREAIHAIGTAAAGAGVRNGPGISVKLSALHPRYSRLQQARVMTELLPRLKTLVLLARRYDIGINIDAEEADRLDLSLDLLEALASDPELDGFDGLGFAVQAYQKRCPFVIDHLVDLARRTGHRIMVRLVKGAYWDSEITRAQIDGSTDYPVYTRKLHTDMSYLVCARKMLAHANVLYPQFATHNAQTLASVQVWATQAGVDDYEFQCLHGMGETLYDQLVGSSGIGARCRIYAPVGPHQTLLGYLVRRLLENGANSSFVNQLVDPNVAVDDLLADPFAAAHAFAGAAHPGIQAPPDLFGSERRNSAGVDFSDEEQLVSLIDAVQGFSQHLWRAGYGDISAAAAAGVAAPVAGNPAWMPVLNPADHSDLVGHVRFADEHDVNQALAACGASADVWRSASSQRRAEVLRRAADLLEAHRDELLVLAVREAGKTLPNAVGEVREAVDFLRFYAAQADGFCVTAPLGTVLCISPWNFPLAIFIGQVSAALAAGNAVLAKPAEQTSLMAARAVALLIEAGVPTAALQLLPGPGATVGARLVADHRIDAVVFTGSTAVARSIHRQLARRSTQEQRELPLIAETGGQNAMIVDSSALPEQVVQDVMASAFDSAGQRCSALRVLCLQSDIADDVLHLLQGALAERRLGDPAALEIDIGPVIDTAARDRVAAHVAGMRSRGLEVREMPLSQPARDALGRGTFIVPTVIEIDSIDQLQQEVFGPVLHVLRYRREQLDALVSSINDTGYGLTMGIHSRIDETIACILARARVGNVYVNRNMIGAVVGVQPFGGEGKSGTGPKAGGPLYLRRLMQVGPDRAIPSAVPAMPPPDPTLHAWLRRRDRGSDSTIKSGRHPATSDLNAISDGQIVLPGPTGESNRLLLAPRGVVLCMAASLEMLLQQLEAACATGNRVMLSASTVVFLNDDADQATGEATKVTTGKSETMPALSVVADDAVADVYCDAVLLDIGLAPQWREIFAARDGMLLPCIVTTCGQAIDRLRLVVERTRTVNTAAAGGNARLMTLCN